jgi:hypothetical protein
MVDREDGRFYTSLVSLFLVFVRTVFLLEADTGSNMAGKSSLNRVPLSYG